MLPTSSWHCSASQNAVWGYHEMWYYPFLCRTCPLVTWNWNAIVLARIRCEVVIELIWSKNQADFIIPMQYSQNSCAGCLETIARIPWMNIVVRRNLHVCAYFHTWYMYHVSLNRAPGLYLLCEIFGPAFKWGPRLLKSFLMRYTINKLITK